MKGRNRFLERQGLFEATFANELLDRRCVSWRSRVGEGTSSLMAYRGFVDAVEAKEMRGRGRKAVGRERMGQRLAGVVRRRREC